MRALSVSDNGAARRLELSTFFRVPRHWVKGEALVRMFGRLALIEFGPQKAASVDSVDRVVLRKVRLEGSATLLRGCRLGWLGATGLLPLVNRWNHTRFHQ